MRRSLLDGVRPSRAASWRALFVLGAMLFALVVGPGQSVAQTSCVNCVRYAGTELNLRREPSLEGEVLRFIPRGAAVQRTAEKDQNGYAPVIYEGVTGWAVSLGFVDTLEEVAEFVVPGTGASSPSQPAPATTTTSPVVSADTRVTLGPLVLRSGPASDAEPILTMPEGALVTLTREGLAEGYVTVSYDGATGWAFADLLAEIGEVPSTAS
jgi:uncharacterized protein YraI